MRQTTSSQAKLVASNDDSVESCACLLSTNAGSAVVAMNYVGILTGENSISCGCLLANILISLTSELSFVIISTCWRKQKYYSCDEDLQSQKKQTTLSFNLHCKQ